MVSVKVSILLQYVTVFVAHRGTAFHYTVYVLIWTNVLYYTITTLLFIFEVSQSLLAPLAVHLGKLGRY